MLDLSIAAARRRSPRSVPHRSPTEWEAAGRSTTASRGAPATCACPETPIAPGASLERPPALGRAGLLHRVHLGAAEPAEAAKVALFPASDDASHLTDPDGGSLALNYTVPVPD